MVVSDELTKQLAQMIGAHASFIRSSKSPLLLSDIERFLHEVTAQSAAPQDLPPWEVIAAFISRLGAQLATTLPKIRNATKSNSTISLAMDPPWKSRVGIIKQAAQYNAETERTLLRLSEESKELLREIRIRDQTLQENGVKVEMLERRLEATRKQADMILELENDVTKAKKQEKVYEDAIEQMQGELDVLEGENAKLRKGQGSSGDRQGELAVTRIARLCELIVIANTASATEPVFYAPSGAESSLLVEQVGYEISIIEKTKLTQPDRKSP